MKVKFTPKRIVLLLFACVAIILAVLACVPTSAEPPICEDFIVNRSFGFILTDKNDVTLFSGVVNNL